MPEENIKKARSMDQQYGIIQPVEAKLTINKYLRVGVWGEEGLRRGSWQCWWVRLGGDSSGGGLTGRSRG